MSLVRHLQMVFVVLEDAVVQSPIWGKVAAKAKQFEAQISMYTPSTPAEEKRSFETKLFEMIEEKCELQPSPMPAIPDGNKEINWDQSTMA